MAIINFKNVSFKYSLSDNLALKNINLEVNESEFLLICGKSGCGKSTLLRLLKKEIAPSGDLYGDIYYKNGDIFNLDLRESSKKIGFVYQNPETQIVTDKVWHELAFGLESLGYDNEVIQRRVAEMASFFGIQKWFRKDVYELSGGQKQLLNLASVMALEPEILVLDEPTSQLDPISSSEFISILKKINMELGTTIILSEHRLEEVFPIVDRVFILNNGYGEICDEPKNVGLYLSNKKEANPMYDGIPTSMRIFSELNTLDTDIPMTVREGKLWLSSIIGSNVIFDSIKNDNKEDSEVVISVEDIWFRYKKDGEDILRDVNLSVEKGSIYGIVGGNGVGKTTLLNIMTTDNIPYRGKVKINNKDIKSYSYSELFTNNICMLPQNPKTIFTEISVYEELLDMVIDLKLSDKEKNMRVSNMLKKLELDNLKDKHAYDLSGGEQQRLGLGKILLLEPKIILLDEPTKGLDPFFKKKLAKIFKDLKNKNVTVILVSHDIEFCAEHCDKCAMMFDGRVVSEESPRDMFSTNNFYTTTSHRISKHIFNNAVTIEDVIYLCQKNLENWDKEI